MRNRSRSFKIRLSWSKQKTDIRDLDLDGFVKIQTPPPNIGGIKRRANFVIMRRTFRTLNDYEMQHNAEVGLSTKPSRIETFARGKA